MGRATTPVPIPLARGAALPLVMPVRYAELEGGHYFALSSCFLLAASAAATLDAGGLSTTFGFGCSGLDGYVLLAAIVHPLLIGTRAKQTPVTGISPHVGTIGPAKFPSGDSSTDDGPERLCAYDPLSFDFRLNLLCA
jgi:hypothetical protein